MSEQRHIDSNWRNREEKQCTLAGMTSDVCLSALKIATGIIGHSSVILADGKTMRVAAADGWLEVLSLQQSGKKRMETDAFLRGYTLPQGCRCQ